MVQRSLGAPRARSVVLGFIVAASIAAPVTAASPAASNGLAVSAGPARGLVLAHGAGQAGASQLHGAKPTPNMSYHGGVIMTTANVHPIFWGTSWPSYSGDKVTGINTFYTGWNVSNYAKTTIEYTGSNGQVGATSSAGAAVIDSSQATGGGSTSAILNEVAKEINAGAVPLDSTGNGYYPVYTDIPRGSAGYCAWHSSGTVNGQRVQFAYFFNLDGDAGCNPNDTTTTHSEGLAALGNVSGHELAEALTDPASPGAWYDSKGYENGDKCAWTFNVPVVSFSDGTQWRVQGEWSNNAYSTGTGYPNSSGQKGCLDGH